MENRDIKKAISINLDNLFRFQTGYYLEQPEWINKSNDIALESWNEYKKYLNKGAKGMTPEFQKYSPSEAEKMEMKNWENRQIQIETCAKIKEPIMNEAIFLQLTLFIESIGKDDIEEIEEKIKNGIYPVEYILKEAQAEKMDLIDWDILEWVACGRPFLESQYGKYLSTFCAVKVLQWIEEIQKDRPKDLDSLKLPMPLQWEGGSKELCYYTFRELFHRGIIKGDSVSQLAEWLVIMFDNVGKITTVNRALSADKREYAKPKGAANIDEILNNIKQE